MGRLRLRATARVFATCTLTVWISSVRHQFGRVGAGQRSYGCAILSQYTAALYQNPPMHKTQAVRALHRPLRHSGETCN